MKDIELPVQLRLVGNWSVEVMASRAAGSEIRGIVEAPPPPPLISISDEVCGSLPVFSPNVGGWLKGYRLAGVVTQETTAKGMFVPETLRLRGDGSDTWVLARGTDYEVDPDWGTVWRLEGGGLGAETTVLASYRYRKARLDSIIELPGGGLELRAGEPHVTQPRPPLLTAGERRLANVFISGRETRLTEANLFPVLETEYPKPARPAQAVVSRLAPKAYAKLTGGGRLRILAWGDSVTDGGYLSDPTTERWQAQFAVRLREKFPKSDVELLTEAWPGRNSTAYLDEPPGAVHNYREKVLNLKPDLIISEFVNDAGYKAPKVDEVYGKLASDFKAISAEWIILTPHYILPGWMGLDQQRDIDDDPRDYVKRLREFSAARGIALADASKRWGRLWRQGVPYMTYMMNAINHPDPCGLKIFADSLMELF